MGMCPPKGVKQKNGSARTNTITFRQNAYRDEPCHIPHVAETALTTPQTELSLALVTFVELVEQGLRHHLCVEETQHKVSSMLCS